MQYRVTMMPMGMPDAKPLSVVVDSVKNQTAAGALLLLAGQMHHKDWLGPEWSKFQEEPEMTENAPEIPRKPLLPVEDHTSSHMTQLTEENLLHRCRGNPRWASEEIVSLRATVKSRDLEIIRLKDDLRFANDLRDVK